VATHPLNLQNKQVASAINIMLKNNLKVCELTQAAIENHQPLTGY